MDKEKLSILFYEIMEECVSDGLLVESTVQDFDSSFAIYEVLEEIFIENYKPVTIEESVMAIFTQTKDPNEALIEAITEALLDESIGSAVATAVHGLGHRIAAYKAGKAQAAEKMRTAAQNKAVSAAGAAASRAKSVEKKSSGGIKGAFKTAVAQGRAEKAKGVAKKAYAAGMAARQKAKEAEETLSAKEKKRTELASKIDTRVGAAKQAVQSGAKKVAGAVGRFIGRFS